jgi:hypothetical protein
MSTTKSLPPAVVEDLDWQIDLLLEDLSRAAREGDRAAEGALEQVRSAREEGKGATLRGIIDALLVSGGQAEVHKCTLPFHDPPHEHWTYRPTVCDRAEEHLFCRRHRLLVCPRCGGSLE